MSVELLKNERPAEGRAGLSGADSCGENVLPKFHTADAGQSQPLDAALKYASRGWHVFPCKPDKRPYTTHGFKDASTDEATIRAWWSEWPNAIPGIRTGAESGVFVVDIDRPKVESGPDGEESLAKLEAQHGWLPRTLTAKTPRGGRHLFFKMPKDGLPIPSRASKIGPALDVRGDGGYVAAAPGRTEAGAYAWVNYGTGVAEAPAWLVEACRRAGTAPTGPRETTPVIELDLPKTIVRETAWLLNKAPLGIAGQGGDDTTFSVAARLRGRGLSEETTLDLMLQFWNERCDPEWDYVDLAKIVRNAQSYGQNAPGAEAPQAAFPIWENPAHLPQGPVRAAAEDYARTEDGVAQHFIDAHEAHVRFNVSRKQWLIWSSTHWRPDETRRVADRIRKLCRHHAQHAKALATSKAVRAVEALAQTDQRIVVTADMLDKDLWLLGTPGGVVDLRTGVLREGRPDDAITKLTSCAPSETEDCPTFLRFIDEITLRYIELQRFLKQFFGYCLTGSTQEEVLLFGYGPGGNGKSKLAEAVMRVLHDYSVTAGIDTFLASRGDRHPTELAALAGARLVSASETERGGTWAEARIKQLTGGDVVTARFMRQDFFSFKPQFKLLVIGNKKPALSSVDEAMRRRFLIVPFTFVPKRKDSELSKKLATEEAGILRWMINGCLDWQEHGLIRPGVVVSATEDYFSAQDVIGSFIDEHCEVGDGLWCKRSECYSAWCSYAKAAGAQHMSEVAFIDEMRARGFRDVNKNVTMSGGKRTSHRAFAGMQVTSLVGGCCLSGDAF
ncbi:hypothetical protein JCM15519_03350 [Fundidesulfovibrio butyratiphilus]